MSSTFLASHASSGFITSFGLTPDQYAFGAVTPTAQSAMPPPMSVAGPSTIGPVPSPTAFVPEQPIPNPNIAPTHLQATLNEIQAIANDVEMKPPPSESGVYLVVDTNILLGYYEALRTFVEDVEKTEVPVVVVVPGIVVQELDRQKNREKLAWPARRASGWLLEKMQSQKVVKVQATEETCKPSKNWRTKIRMDELHISEDMMNDHLILDCAQYYLMQGRETKVCSADNNVRIIAQSQGIECIAPPARGLWTSLDIARSIYGRSSPLVEGFTASTAALGHGSNLSQPRRTAGPGPRGGYAQSAGIEDSDQMLIDEDTDSLSTQETPLNVLHDDVREYFTRLLLQLAARQGASELRAVEGASRHAPAYVRKDYRTWNAAECLQYLYDQSPGLQRQMVSPTPEVFLSKRYTARGARTGNEWSPKDWHEALENVARVGAAFGDISLGESVKDLQEYLRVVLVTIRDRKSVV